MTSQELGRKLSGNPLPPYGNGASPSAQLFSEIPVNEVIPAVAYPLN